MALDSGSSFREQYHQAQEAVLLYHQAQNSCLCPRVTKVATIKAHRKIQYQQAQRVPQSFFFNDKFMQVVLHFVGDQQLMPVNDLFNNSQAQAIRVVAF